jgi:hypothetical protein
LYRRKQLKGVSYYWERRKVVKRGMRNWLAWALREPFRPKGRPDETVIVFVRLNARARAFNLGYILRKNEGIRTILLTKVFDYDFQREAFNEIHLFFNYKDLREKVARLARRYNLLAVVGSTQPARQTRILIEMPRDWPVLIDQYDSLWALSYFSGMDLAEARGVGAGVSPEEVAEEEYCFRHAEGVIVRSGELQVLFKEQDVMTPNYLFEDSCNSRYFQPVTPRNGPKEGEWSVVYPGIFYPMSFDSRIAGDTQLVPLGKLFAEERIHFHLYPSPHHNYQYPEYEAEAARNPYFHLHQAVDFDKVHREIGKYDFGWYANDYSKWALFSEVYRQHTLSIKFYTFLEAGLSVITNGLHVRSERIVQRMGAGIVVGTDAPKGLRQVIEKQNLPELIQGVERARAELDINRRSGELLAFIKEVRERYERT